MTHSSLTFNPSENPRVRFHFTCIKFASSLVCWNVLWLFHDAVPLCQAVGCLRIKKWKECRMKSSRHIKAGPRTSTGGTEVSHSEQLIAYSRLEAETSRTYSRNAEQLRWTTERTQKVRINVRSYSHPLDLKQHNFSVYSERTPHIQPDLLQILLECTVIIPNKQACIYRVELSIA